MNWNQSFERKMSLPLVQYTVRFQGLISIAEDNLGCGCRDKMAKETADHDGKLTAPHMRQYNKTRTLPKN